MAGPGLCIARWAVPSLLRQPLPPPPPRCPCQAAKLGLPSVQDTESIVAKAIR